MNVQIKHNGTTITSRVISYVREHRICTSIGTLEITLEGTYSTAINPWDTFDIYENGSFKVRYYVSDVTESIPSGTITANCQDKSKRLVDYFIPDSYTVDYPSYTRYWIQKFLTEAGISYTFTVASQGNLLSNNTSLGLQSGYDQIMMLLQLSGWYMYFAGNGVAVIGSLDIDLADTAGTLDRTDIVNIIRVSNDDMLRNRAVVWGQYDVIRQEYAYADVSRHTRWNYDHKDKRAIVISNSNIPNKESAYGIANILIKEFADITTEKHITATGARNFKLGDGLIIESDIWKGKGLVTTFGTSMDRSGLVTNIVLDERCPRLFGFFNFGDYVYVGTFGDGVWRKHIKFDPTWYDFSSGITDLNITDLHINNAIYGSVSASGFPYYANNELGPWYQLIIDSLDSSKDDTVPSGGTVVYQPYSGIMARATIVDKLTNNVKFGVDTWSGLNTGDYFLTWSGLIPNYSGYPTTSGCRGWIVEYDPYTGNLVGGIGSGIYPIQYSGNYTVNVLDLENDGVNDYVSIKSPIGGTLIPSGGFGYDFGYRTSQPANLTNDTHILNSYNVLDDFDLEGESLPGTATTVGTATTLRVAVFNDESNYDRIIAWTQLSGASFVAKRTLVFKIGGILATHTATSPTISGAASILAISKYAPEVYRIYYDVTTTAGYNRTETIYYREWDVNAGTLSAAISCGSVTMTREKVKADNNRDFLQVDSIVIDDVIYFYIYYLGFAAPDFTTDVTNYIKIYGLFVNINTSTSIFSGLLHNQAYHDADGILFGDNWKIFSLTGSLPFVKTIFQNDNRPSLVFYIREWNNDFASATILNNYLLYSTDGYTFINSLLQSTTNRSDSNFVPSGTEDASQLNNNSFIKFIRNATNTMTYKYCGGILSMGHVSSIPFQWASANIFPMFGVYDLSYVAKNGSSYYWCNPYSAELGGTISFPANYTPIKIFSTSSSFDTTYYWHCTNNDTGFDEILRFTLGGYSGTSIKPFFALPFDQARGFIAGNFFIDYAGGTTLRWFYVDNQDFPNSTGSYVVLQRDGMNFNPIRVAQKPIRIDISNNSPVLTVLDYENSFHSDYIYGNNVTQIIPTSGLVMENVRDYRYTMLEVDNGVMTSGIAATSQIVYVRESGVYVADISTYSGGFTLFDSIPSGIAERVEISNYAYPGQFIFVTTSGENPAFYQRDNDGLFFDLYSGLPSSRATIIRLDDRF